MSTGYYRSSLDDWRKTLLRDRKRFVSRLRALEERGHVCAADQKLLIDINDRFLAIIEEARREEEG
jgi:hypothetical protein